MHTVFLAQRAKGNPVRPVLLKSLHSSKKYEKYKVFLRMEETILLESVMHTNENNKVEVLVNICQNWVY